MQYTTITHTTVNKREQLKKMLDQFSTFTWNGKRAFDEFGAFIINENKEGLKFYNGPSFSNEYTSPQFAKNKEFIGVNFEQQKISFKIGVYWISIEDYRKFLDWLNPYIISKLSFTFAEKWTYQVKLAGREESVRYVVGYENSEPRYYSEMNLNFEVQGEPCLSSLYEFKWNLVSQDNNKNYRVYQIDTTPEKDWPTVSDLPIDFSINFTCCAKDTTEGSIQGYIYYNIDDSNIMDKQLFLIELKNLTMALSLPYLIQVEV